MAGLVGDTQQRIALVIQYLGTHYHGWQWQPRQRSIQSEIESAISGVLGEPVRLHGAGRTDTGVHAAAQVAHFDTNAVIPAHRWPAILNGRLPKDILVRGAVAVSLPWHARFSAIWRRYRYTLYTDPLPNLFLAPLAWHYYHHDLDVSQMQAALEPLLGQQNLATFERAGSSRPHTWVEVQEVSCQRRGAVVEIEVQASGFLYGMMRLLVGLLVQVGSGQRSSLDFTRIWQQNCRDEVKYSAPAKGLCLLRVGYPDFPLSQEVWFDTLPRWCLSPAHPDLSIA
ncbi:tRNA pseudouridine(38-40) synthase TruA [Thermosynechococcaceae cyanobacterium BACA0444]|uniref:tRNA pseudouridine synthase A n=1 Tax=Pseudocalidococcus azoricus BACA0444 TaxID=2918990 RepID=A0AAE4FP01_9CYAN|nr:tRNA pseudouridine(38-40) synthase TruA [Pseudocalidococcus azoricus]MDS3859486.1 tRNA pseudouridine(38-40) synthase TruA [Pseudocalidococcus azoricus BACA0444]